MTKSIAAYVRVSTDDQFIENQEVEIKKWLDAKGYDANRVRWFVDDGISAKNTNRPALKKMLAAIADGTITTVVVWRMDRLCRNAKDGVNLMHDFADAGIRFDSVMESGISFEGVMGRMIANILFSIAELERETLLQRQRPGIERAKREGKYKGRKLGSRVFSPKRVWDLKQKGLSVPEICKATGASRSTVFQYLKEAR